VSKKKDMASEATSKKPEGARVLQQQGVVAAVLKAFVEIKHRSIIVLGFSGAGKTSMLKYMFGITEPTEDLENPTLDVRQYLLEIGKVFRVTDTPGHPILKPRLDEEIKNLVRGDYQGVIDVVAYGFNQSKHLSSLVRDEGLGSLESYNRSKPLMADGKVNPNYIRRERELEVDYLKSWINLVGDRSKLRWIITVVNKADLWRKQLGEVLDHYGGSGEYAALIKQELPQVPHEVLPLSCSVDGFYGVSRKPPQGNGDWRQELKERFLMALQQRLS
jgi:energy-coupling factor transporter ATP-binding protein EcfA2